MVIYLNNLNIFIQLRNKCKEILNMLNNSCQERKNMENQESVPVKNLVNEFINKIAVEKKVLQMNLNKD